MNPVSQRISSLLLASQKSKVEVSAATGISTSAMSKYTKGATPKAEQLLELARYFQVSMEWLLTGKETQSTNRERADLPASSRRLLEEVRKAERIELASIAKRLSLELLSLSERLQNDPNADVDELIDGGGGMIEQPAEHLSKHKKPTGKRRSN